jgi:hypothetical protein
MLLKGLEPEFSAWAKINQRDMLSPDKANSMQELEFLKLCAEAIDERSRKVIVPCMHKRGCVCELDISGSPRCYIDLIRIDGDRNPADGLTKPLDGRKFKEFIDMLGMNRDTGLRTKVELHEDKGTHI